MTYKNAQPMHDTAQAADDDVETVQMLSETSTVTLR